MPSPKTTRRSPLRENHEPEDVASIPPPQSPATPQRSYPGSYEPGTPEHTPTRRSSRVVEKQTSPTKKSTKDFKLKSPKLINPPKLPTIQEARRKRQEKAARYAERWRYITDKFDKHANKVIIFLISIVVIRFAAEFNPYSVWRNPEAYEIDFGFSALHSLTGDVMYHSSSQCLDLALIRNTLTAPTEAFKSVASALPQGDIVSTTLKAKTLSYAEKASDVSATSQNLYKSFLGIDRPVISSLGVLLSAFNYRPPHDPANPQPARLYSHFSFLSSPSHYAPLKQFSVLNAQPEFSRQEARRLLVMHLDKLLSLVATQAKELDTLVSQLRTLDQEWRGIVYPITEQKARLRTQIAGLSAEHGREWWPRYAMRTFVYSDRLIKHLRNETDNLDIFFNPLNDSMLDENLHPKLEYEQAMQDRGNGRRMGPATQVELALSELSQQLETLRETLLEARKGLRGRSMLWRWAFWMDDKFMHVKFYSESLAQLKKESLTKWAEDLQTCRNGFKKEVKDYKKKGPGPHRIDERFPELNSEEFNRT